jgi:hypothetical protein
MSSPTPPAAGDASAHAAYLRKHNMHALLDHLVAGVAAERPRSPYRWLAEQVELEVRLRRGNQSLVPTAHRPARHAVANPSLPR